jgi:hypothetical protein
MENRQSKNSEKNLNTLGELTILLNRLADEEFGENIHAFTKKQLLYYTNPDIPNRYKVFQISKKSGGTREICAPKRKLGNIQYLLNLLFRYLYTPSASVTGFVEGRSVVDNARMHVGHHYVFNIDLKDFFPSISQARVWARLQLAPFNFSKEVANVVAALCCHKNAEGNKNVLPQGAATSPLLANAVCDALDRKMEGVAKRFGLHYSRYADDITFSSMHNVYQEGGEFRREIERIIREQGFTMNERKTRLQRTHQRQEVTGLTVNQKPNVGRQYISDLRWILHVWETEGYAKAYSKFYPRYKRSKGYIKKGEPVMENVIGGKLNYLRMVKGENNEACNKLLARYNRLQQVIYVDSETDKKEQFVYVQPYTMTDFKTDFSTDISLVVTESHKLVGRCVLAGMEKNLAISSPTQKALCPDLDIHEPGDTVQSPLLENCYVTLCRKRGKNFWLITLSELKRSWCMSIQNAQLDIDRLLEIWEELGLEHAVKAFHSVLEGKELPERRPSVIRVGSINFSDDDDEELLPDFLYEDDE